MSMNILITGATGLVATELIVRLLNLTNYQLILVSRSPEKIRGRYKNYSNRIISLRLEELMSDSRQFNIDTCVHTAFARSSNGNEIALSLNYLCQLCNCLKENPIKKFINISSQSVYGNNYIPYVKEDGKCNPDYLYALGKYSSELICKEIFKGSDVDVMNIRLASVVENARFIKVFVDNAIKGNPINIVAPRQFVSFIDVRDVATAILAVINFKGPVSDTYNLGTTQNYSIKYVAETVKKVAENNYQFSNIDINIKDNGIDNKIGMDASKFMSTFKWEPRYTLQDMIVSLYEMLNNVNRGGYPIAFKLVYGIQNSL